jgi:hypothetical protein
MGRINKPHKKKNRAIPENAAILKNKQDKESQKLHISFEYYQNSECQITNLSNNFAKRILEDLKRIGQLSSTTELSKANICTDSVRGYDLSYKKFYKGLSPDVKLKEHKINKWRIFYFIVEKIFNVRCIVLHPELGKR